jgi:transcriptional regulator with XRE-family HTH domain
MPPLSTPDPEAARFGAVVQRLRQQKGWSLADLGKLVKLSPVYLSILERGRNIPSLTVILRLARALGADAGEMIREVAASR